MAKSKIKFFRTRDVLLPQRGHKHDAGIDFFVPNFDTQFIEDLKKKNPHLFEVCLGGNSFHGISVASSGTLTISSSETSPKLELDLSDNNDTMFKVDDKLGVKYFPLPPMGRINIPSGIYCKMEEPGRALIAANKSGIASKKGLIFGAQVIDYEYQGEIHINVINTSNKVVRVHEGMKLLQFIEMPIFTSSIEEVEGFSELYPQGETSRADGGFGSTDQKPEQLNS